MSFRYENYGTADLLTVKGTTVTSNSAIYGTAFYQTAQSKCFDIPACQEIWIKFDVYFGGSKRWRAYNEGTNGLIGITAQKTQPYGRLSFFANDVNVQEPAGIVKTNQRQTVLLHMISGSSAGVIEAWVDGKKIYRYTGDVNHGENFADIYLQSDGAGTYFSNVIISDEEIGLNENARIPFEIINDTERTLTNYSLFSITADTRREVIITFSINNDTNRQLVEKFSIVNDTSRKLIDSYRYENYGTADLLTVEGTTVTSNSAIYGTAFYQMNDSACFDIPTTFKEIWMKFDVYMGSSSSWIALNQGAIGGSGICGSYYFGYLLFCVNDEEVLEKALVCKTNKRQTILLHMVSDSSMGVIEAWVDGTRIYRYTGDVNHGYAFADICLRSTDSNTFFSNVIISNKEIGLNENATSPDAVPFELRNDTERNLFESLPFSLSADTRRELQMHFNLSCDTIKRVPHRILLDALL